MLTSLRGCGIMDGQNNLLIALRRCKRQRKEVNYKEESSLELRRSKKVAKLYPVTITEEKCEGDRAMVKIHYEDARISRRVCTWHVVLMVWGRQLRMGLGN